MMGRRCSSLIFLRLMGNRWWPAGSDRHQQQQRRQQHGRRPRRMDVAADGLAARTAIVDAHWRSSVTLGGCWLMVQLLVVVIGPLMHSAALLAIGTAMVVDGRWRLAAAAAAAAAPNGIARRDSEVVRGVLNLCFSFLHLFVFFFLKPALLEISWSLCRSCR